MNLIPRVFLVWLLLLAVPFQGLAAASMLPCAPATPARAMSMPGHDHAAMMAAAAKAAHCAQAADHGAGAHDSHDGRDGHHGNGSCASCCIGAAMAPAALPALALAPPEFVSIPFRPGHVPSVDPALPERPPRTILA